MSLDSLSPWLALPIYSLGLPHSSHMGKAAHCRQFRRYAPALRRTAPGALGRWSTTQPKGAWKRNNGSFTFKPSKLYRNTIRHDSSQHDTSSLKSKPFGMNADQSHDHEPLGDASPGWDLCEQIPGSFHDVPLGGWQRKAWSKAGRTLWKIKSQIANFTLSNTFILARKKTYILDTPVPAQMAWMVSLFLTPFS